jgi:hypothetical protein
MRTLFFPLYRMAVSYVVSSGRRWSVLEHLLLFEVASSKRTTAELADLTGMPDRLVVEALINLLRASWLEVRSTEAGVFFAATAAGRRWAAEPELPATLQREVKWLSVCLDRLTGSWLRADELDLVHEKEVPADADTVAALKHTFDPNDGALRDLFTLDADESLEPTPPQFRNASRYMARVGVAFGHIETGLPPSALPRLRQALIEAARELQWDVEVPTGDKRPSIEGTTRDDIGDDDIVVGGRAHLEMLRAALERTRSAFILHTCFLNPETMRLLLPDLEKAARRKVRIDLLWGLHVDPEEPEHRKPKQDSDKVLDLLPEFARRRVQLSPVSSGSHAKVVLYDDRATGAWTSIVGSCNFLSSEFDWIEASVRTRNQGLAAQLVGHLIAAQLPASGAWSPVARRLNRIWSDMRRRAAEAPSGGTHSLSLLVDQDHYAYVLQARDLASRDIVIGCDLYGVAAETSVLVPMQRAAELGKKVSLTYNRPSRYMTDEGRAPDPNEIAKRGIAIRSIAAFHAKYAMWDDDALAITSFNWLSTVVDGTRARGAEIGLSVSGKDIRQRFEAKLEQAIVERAMQSVAAALTS